MYRDHDTETSFRAVWQAPPGVPSSEARVKRGNRIVGVDTALVEKLGRNDLCPCGSAPPLSAAAAGEPAVSRSAGRLLRLGLIRTDVQVRQGGSAAALANAL